MTKTLICTVLTMIATQASAASYTCRGVDSVSQNGTEIVLTDLSPSSVDLSYSEIFGSDKASFGKSTMAAKATANGIEISGTLKDPSGEGAPFQAVLNSQKTALTVSNSLVPTLTCTSSQN